MLFCLQKQIIGQLSADADCQMADTNYQPIIGAPLVAIDTIQCFTLFLRVTVLGLHGLSFDKNFATGSTGIFKVLRF